MGIAVKSKKRLIAIILGSAVALVLVPGLIGTLLTWNVVKTCEAIKPGDDVTELQRLERSYFGSVAKQETDYSFDTSKPYDPRRKTYQMLFYHGFYLSNAVCVVEHDGVHIVWRGLQGY